MAIADGVESVDIRVTGRFFYTPQVSPIHNPHEVVMGKAWYFGLISLAALLFCPSAQTDEPTKEQKTEWARRVTSAEPYDSEIPSLDERYPYADLSDEELDQEYTKTEQRLADAQAARKKDYQAFEDYKDSLVREGKTTRQELDMGVYEDPSGRLAELEERLRASRRVVLDTEIAEWKLASEREIREDPDSFLAAEANIQTQFADGRAIGEYWLEKHQQMLAGDPEGWEYAQDQERRARDVRIQAGRPVLEPPLFPEEALPPALQAPASPNPDEVIFNVGAAAQLPPSTTLVKIDPSLIPESGTGSAVTVTYKDLYGPNANPAVIEQIERNEIKRLPAELRRGVPREIQRLFIYGRYENMPRDQKRYVKYVFRRLNQQVKSRQELQQAFGSAYNAAQNMIAPEGLSNQTPANAANAAAYLLMALTQKLLGEVTAATRQRHFAEAFEAVAAEIPRGQAEQVLFIEDVERVWEFTFGAYPRTLEVTGYRTNLRALSEQQTLDLLGKLDDLRQPSEAEHYHFYRFRRAYGATIVGTGERVGERPSIREALQAGGDMGRLMRDGKIDMNLLLEIVRMTYARFREWDDTRRAFRLAYGAQAQASEDLRLAELMDLLDKKQEETGARPVFNGKWRVRFGNWWILTIQEAGGKVSGTIEADYEDAAEKKRKGVGTIKGDRRDNVVIGKAPAQDGISGEISIKRQLKKFNPETRTHDLVMVDHDLKQFQFRIEDDNRLRGEFCYQIGDTAKIGCRSANGERIAD